MALSMAAFQGPRLNSRRLEDGYRFWGRKSLIPASLKIQKSCPPIKSIKSCPWLMLPPSWDDETSSVGYNFYDLADNQTLTLPQTKSLKHLMPKPIRDLRICGSSHGWIGLFNPQTLDLFIYNPISLRHIMLPSIRNLPNCPKHMNQRFVTKLFLSCSPEDSSSCCAVMISNCIDGAAFCYPGRSSVWTPFGNDGYDDFVFSTKQNLYFGINDSHELETWDLSDPSSPRFVMMIDTYDDKYFDPSLPSLYDGWPVKPDPVKYLVVADDDVLLVTRYVISDDYPRMTVGFYIGLYQDDEELITGTRTLDDLVIFIGSCSHSLALKTSEFPQLKSKSIYFTDQYMEFGHDIGIFDIEKQTVSPCYYPCDRPSLKRILPSPEWFFPRR